MTHHTLLALAPLLLLTGCGGDRPVAVTDARVQLPVIAGRPGVAYFTVVGGGADTHLTGISSPVIKRIELHDTMSGGGMMRMTPLAQVPVNRELRFARGGKHAMLFGIDPKLRAGDKVKLVLAFAPAGEVSAEAEVTKLGGG